MSSYMTEEEQIAAIKNWWKRYDRLILLIVSSIFIFIGGYKYWNWHNEKIISEASSNYERLMMSVSKKDQKGIYAFSNLLINEYNGTVYSDIARLILAKNLIGQEKYNDALIYLQYIASYSKKDVFKNIAKIRIARIFYELKKYDEALKFLDNLKFKAFTPVVNELKGDIYASLKQYPKALTFYKEAMDENNKKGIGIQLLEIKTNQILALQTSRSEVKNVS